LHAVGGRPAETYRSDHPWLIRVVEPAQTEEVVSAVQNTESQLSEESLVKLQRALAFSYKHSAATMAPSKMTATQRKGRPKDQEAAEYAEEPRQITHSWRRPAFAGQEAAGKTYGSAIHAVMQYICYEKCTDEDSIDAQIQELADRGFITAEAGEMVDRKRIAAFFGTDLGKKLRCGTPYVREFKFSILDDGDNYGEGLQGEKVLLQGVVDCAMIEDDGITIIDFKTDRVSDTSVEQLVDHYRTQVETYAQAMSRIYQKPVKAAYLYFFRLNRFIPI